MTSADAVEAPPGTGIGRARRYAVFVWSMIRLHPRMFATAVAGGFMFSLCTVASSSAVEWVIDHVIVPRFEDGRVATSTVVAGCALVIGIGLLRATGVVIRRSFASRAVWRSAATLQDRVADQLVEQPLSWHHRYPDGQLIARGGVDVDTTIRVMNPLPFALSTLLLLVVSGVWLIYTDTVMGIVAVAVFPVLMITNIVYERLVSEHFDQAQDALGRFTGEVHESFEAVHLVKVYGAEHRETERLSRLAGDVRDPRVRAVRVRAVFESVLELVPSLTNIGLVVLGAWRVREGHLSIGELSGFIFMFTLLVFPLRLIAYALGELPQSYSGYARVRATIDEPLDPDPEESLGRTSGSTAVALEGVTFHYPGDAHPAIRGANAVIEAGKVTALVGPTGSGKSTLVALIGGLLAPTTGTVSVPAGQRAIVFQEPFLFGGSVADNVRLGLPDDTDLWEALRLAAAEPFVAELPDRLDTVVGERGVSLSGGQRQRVALARALARRPELLVLDDTTSALDPATEQTVLANLRSGLAGTTVVIVASRPSTIALADRVLYVADGRIADQGTHAELYARHADYRELVDAFETDREATGGPTVEVAPGEGPA